MMEADSGMFVEIQMRQKIVRKNSTNEFSITSLAMVQKMTLLFLAMGVKKPIIFQFKLPKTGGGFWSVSMLLPVKSQGMNFI